MLAFRIFDDSGFSKKLRAIPEDDEGIDIEYLKQEIKKSEDKAVADGNDAPVSSSTCMRTIPLNHSVLFPDCNDDPRNRSKLAFSLMCSWLHHARSRLGGEGSPVAFYQLRS